MFEHWEETVFSLPNGEIIFAVWRHLAVILDQPKIENICQLVGPSVYRKLTTELSGADLY